MFLRLRRVNTVSTQVATHLHEATQAVILGRKLVAHLLEQSNVAKAQRDEAHKYLANATATVKRFRDEARELTSNAAALREEVEAERHFIEETQDLIEDHPSSRHQFEKEIADARKFIAQAQAGIERAEAAKGPAFVQAKFWIAREGEERDKLAAAKAAYEAAAHKLRGAIVALKGVVLHHERLSEVTTASTAHVGDLQGRCHHATRHERRLRERLAELRTRMARLHARESTVLSAEDAEPL